MEENWVLAHKKRIIGARNQERIRNAAPAMLEALIEIESQLSRGFLDESASFALAELARAAINKAKGEV